MTHPVTQIDSLEKEKCHFATSKIMDALERTIKGVSDMTRRSALNTIVLSGAAGAIAISPIPLSGNSILIEKLNPIEMTSADWNQFVGDVFLFGGPAFDAKASEQVGTTLRLKKLVESKLSRSNDPHRPANLRPTSISLLFVSSTKIPNATYAVEHRDLEKSHLFLHQVLLDNDQEKTYEAVLN
jgi:hypothetical protein